MPNSGAKGVEKVGLFALAPIVGLFFLWGVANNLNDVLIAQFRKAFSLGDLQSGLVQSAFYLGYFLFALPAALFMRRMGFKAAVVLGLVLYGAGALLFYPAAESRTYGAFLAALFVIAAGLAFLETSANPLILVMGSPQGATRRLNLAQAFNPLGSITGVLIGRQFIFSGDKAGAGPLTEAQRAAAAHAVQTPYLAIGLFVLVWAGLIAITRFPRAAVAANTAEEGGGLSDIGALFKRPRYLFAVLAQFFYVGAQVGVWSFLIRYAQRETGADERTAASYLIISLAAFLGGRFVGVALMGRVKPERLTAAFGLINLVLCLVAVFAPGTVGLWALIASSAFMSVMFPTIFALGVKDLGPQTKMGWSFLVMAIIGGAALTAAMGYISDLAGIATAMGVPALAFGVVAWFAASSTPALAADEVEAVAEPTP